MKTIIKKISLLALFLFIATTAHADIKKEKGKDKADELQRAPYGLFDLQRNTVSNFSFYTTNYGIFGLNVPRSEGGGFWPRGSRNQYIFGGGLWFAAEKTFTPPGTTTSLNRRYVTITYNPNNGRSWMVPGVTTQKPNGSVETRVDRNDITKYRTYFSTDFSPADGIPFDKNDGPNWPIWDAGTEKDTLKRNRYFGIYIDDVNQRNKTTFAKGPAFISGEDIFAAYHDGDLSYYDGGEQNRRNQGYPLGLQYEQMIYSWGFGDYQNFIFMRVDMINRSKDTLRNCWLAPVMDVDIARTPAVFIGASNDKANFYEKDPSLNLAFQWSNPEFGEGGNGFGYLGFDFLESPAVMFPKKIVEIVRNPNDPEKFDTIFSIDTQSPDYRFVRKDSLVYANSSQLGLVTFRNWSIADDPLTDEERYNFLSKATRDGDTGPGDKRFMMATGPYNLRPGDTSKVVFSIQFASASKGKDPDGTEEDLKALLTINKFAQAVYDNNFQAPSPPDRARLSSRPINHGIEVSWDFGSEMSLDTKEDGLDFLGYTLYRARRTDLVGYAQTEELDGQSRRGPLGWKPIRTWRIPTPFRKSYLRSGRDLSDTTKSFLDSLRIVGPYTNANGSVIDTMAIRVMRIGQGFIMIPDSFNFARFRNYAPRIAGIDTFATNQPWGKFYVDHFGLNPVLTTPLEYRNKGVKLFDSVCIGIIKLNRANLAYNPLYYRRSVTNMNLADSARIWTKNGIIRPTFSRTDTLKSKVKDTITNTYPDSVRNGQVVTVTVEIEDLRVDTVYNLKSYKRYVDPSNGQVIRLIDILTPRTLATMLTDSAHIREVLDSAYSYQRQGLATFELEGRKVIVNADGSRTTTSDPENFEESEVVRAKVIRDYFSNVTRNRKFVDLGDDDNDNIIKYNADPTQTEKLVNNVPYYYKLLAFDEGHVNQQTEVKINEGQTGLPNFTTSYPSANPVGSGSVKFDIISQDADKLGGVRNFRVFAIDNDRVMQNYLGDTLEFTFNTFFNEVSYTPQSSLLNNQEEIAGNYYFSIINGVNLSKKETFYNTFFNFEPNLCRSDAFLRPTDNTATHIPFVLPQGTYLRDGYLLAKDTIVVVDTNSTTGFRDSIFDVLFSDLGSGFNKDIFLRKGTFTTGDFTDNAYCYANGFTQGNLGQLGFSFDFAWWQHGGMFRPDSLTRFQGLIDTNVTTVPIRYIEGAYIQKDRIMNAQPLRTTLGSYTWVPGTTPGVGNFQFSQEEGFNNGPGEYLVEFLPGGEEKDVTLSYGGVTGANRTTALWDLQYLNVKVTNIKEMKTDYPGLGEQTVGYKGELPHFVLPDQAPERRVAGTTIAEVNHPDPRNLGATETPANEFQNKFNIAAFGWVNSRRANKGIANFPRLIARPNTGPLRDKDATYTGLPQGRYYTSAVSKDGKNAQIDFTHIVNIGGIQYALDFANIGRFNRISPRFWDTVVYSGADPQNVFKQDFKAGDKIVLRSTGGVFGLPQHGSKVKVVVSASNAGGDISSKELDGIGIAPNPFMVSHEGQVSSYDNKIFFTKLPKVCTIEIYTLSGELVRTLQHDENLSSENREGVEVWNLLTKNKQRVASQMFLAVIKTPGGSETIKKFAVVVGNFRLAE
jgi:hypothetical protein